MPSRVLDLQMRGAEGYTGNVLYCATKGLMRLKIVFWQQNNVLNVEKKKSSVEGFDFAMVAPR